MLWLHPQSHWFQMISSDQKSALQLEEVRLLFCYHVVKCVFVGLLLAFLLLCVSVVGFIDTVCVCVCLCLFSV